MNYSFPNTVLTVKHYCNDVFLPVFDDIAKKVVAFDDELITQSGKIVDYIIENTNSLFFFISASLTLFLAPKLFILGSAIALYTNRKELLPFISVQEKKNAPWNITSILTNKDKDTTKVKIDEIITPMIISINLICIISYLTLSFFTSYISIFIATLMPIIAGISAGQAASSYVKSMHHTLKPIILLFSCLSQKESAITH